MREENLGFFTDLAITDFLAINLGNNLTYP
jgi:hypothetical protein